jgi:hypothetical protein
MMVILSDQKIPTNDRAEARFIEQTKVEKMGMF